MQEEQFAIATEHVEQVSLFNQNPELHPTHFVAYVVPDNAAVHVEQFAGHA